MCAGCQASRKQLISSQRTCNTYFLANAFYLTRGKEHRFKDERVSQVAALSPFSQALEPYQVYSVQCSASSLFHFCRF